MSWHSAGVRLGAEFTVLQPWFDKGCTRCNNDGITFFNTTAMTMTVKLDAPLERALRRRSADLGLPASVLMREALQEFLTKTEPAPRSAFALGQDLFGRHAGPTDLACARKAELTVVWGQKRPVAPALRGKA